jgi:hypothetical protein
MIRITKKGEAVNAPRYTLMEDWTDEDWEEYLAQWYMTDEQVLKQVQEIIAPLLIEEE